MDNNETQVLYRDENDGNGSDVKEIRNSAKSDASTIPIIAMTANAMREDKMECIEFGMNAYIAKPIDIKKLYALMDDIIK